MVKKTDEKNINTSILNRKDLVQIDIKPFKKQSIRILNLVVFE